MTRVHRFAPLLLLLFLTAAPAAAAPAATSAPSPDALTAGSGSFVTVDVTASTDLDSVAVEALPSTGLAVSGENPAALGDLAAGESAEVSFWVEAAESATTGPAGLQLRVTGVAAGSGESLTHTEEETLFVSGGGEGPAIRADPVSLEPGGEAEVTVTLDPGEELRNVELRLAPTRTGLSVAGLDTRDLGTVGDEATATFRVRADPGAAEGVYGVNVVAEHRDGSTTRRLGVEVEGAPRLVVSARAAGRPGGAAVEGNVSNVGTGPAHGVVARLPNGSTDAVGTVPPGEDRRFTIDTSRVSPGTRVTVTHRRNGEWVEEHHPVSAGTGPVLSLSEVNAERESGRYVVTGTVANTGSGEAFGVLLRVRNASGAAPVYPSRSYFAGSLAPDDFARFELTAETDGDRLPVAVEYGSLGDRETRNLSLPLPTEPRDAESSAPDTGPLLAVITVAAAGVIGAVAYSWRG